MHYAGINMNDVLRATGVIPNKSYDIGYGMELSGVTERFVFVLRYGGAR